MGRTLIFLGSFGFFIDKFHGSNGPLHIEPVSFAPLKEEWLKAGEELGYKIQDPNGYQTESMKHLFGIYTKYFYG